MSKKNARTKFSKTTAISALWDIITKVGDSLKHIEEKMVGIPPNLPA